MIPLEYLRKGNFFSLQALTVGSQPWTTESMGVLCYSPCLAPSFLHRGDEYKMNMSCKFAWILGHEAGKKTVCVWPSHYLSLRNQGSVKDSSICCWIKYQIRAFEFYMCSRIILLLSLSVVDIWWFLLRSKPQHCLCSSWNSLFYYFFFPFNLSSPTLDTLVFSSFFSGFLQTVYIFTSCLPSP